MARTADGGAFQMMSPRIRLVTLAIHVTTSVGLLGAVASFLVLAVTGLAGEASAYVAMRTIAWLLIVPLMGAALVVGVVESLGTPWGLFRTWWVVVKLVVTVLAAAVLLLQLRLIDAVAAFAAAGAIPADLTEGRMALVLHSAGGLAVLLLPAALSIWKPRGRLYG